MKFDQEFDGRGDIVGLQDHRAAVCPDGNRPGVQNRRLDFTGIDHRRANAARSSSRPRQMPSADWPNFDAE